MFTQYFGHYLFTSGIITGAQYREMLEAMKGKRAQLGVMAISAGYMTPNQVEETHVEQMKVDKRFGEIAVSKGFLTHDQLGRLVASQERPLTVFSQLMIDRGYMTYDELEGELANYKRECGMSDTDFDSYSNDDTGVMAELLMPNRMVKNKDALNCLVQVYIKLFTRFIGSDIDIGTASVNGKIGGEWSVMQKVTGDINITVTISGSEDDLCLIASRFSQIEFRSLDGIAQDVLGEFLNCCNGIYLSNMEEQGMTLDLLPQKVTYTAAHAKKGTEFVFPVKVESAGFTFAADFID